MRKLAILTSGGDAPAMNACIRAVVRCGEEFGFKVVGVINGYQGLIEENFKPLELKDVDGIITQSGTILKTSRCDDFMTEKGFNRAVQNAKKQNFECLIVLGGDGSLKGAERLQKAGINTIGIPCTIDNDIKSTDLTIGFSTAVNTVMGLLGNIRDTSSSHGRICVVQVMGRASGELAFNAGMASGAELILVPEVKTSENEIIDKVQKSIGVGEKSVIVVVAEGFGTAKDVASKIKEKIGIEAKDVDLGYVQRGGLPVAEDRILATKMGITAVSMANAGESGVAVCYKNGKMRGVPLPQATKKRTAIDTETFKINNIISV